MSAQPHIRQNDGALAWCDREPIHVPGAVQAHGGLLAFGADDRRIVYRSENLLSLLELDTEALGSTIDELLGAQSAELLTTRGLSDLDSVPVSLSLPSERSLNATAHRSDALFIVEFEPPAPAAARSVLIHRLRHAVSTIEAADSVEAACAAAVEEVRHLTGYDRVMVYRFHEDEHGEVVAESRGPKIESYLGLHYPASDIPLPARRLLRLSPVRLIVDVNALSIPLAGAGTFGSRPLDLSRSTLRAVSPIHLQYLRNMDVAASLTVSLIDGPSMWGLLACHHRTPKLVSPELRSACAVVARTLWQKIDAENQREESAQRERRLLLYARFLTTVSSVQSLAEALVEDGRFLLDLVGADGVFLRVDGAYARLGTTPSRDETAALVELVSALPATAAVATDELGVRFPGLGIEPRISGILALPVANSWSEHVIWFRGETERDLTWAGDPAKPIGAAPSADDAAETVAISPRTSFAAWRELTRGRSLPWSRADLEVAEEFAAALPAIHAARGRDALARLALRDQLTGLPNRAVLHDRIEKAVADLQRSDGSLWILFLDLDGFKEVNDTFGHESGDLVLIEVAARLLRTVRASDTVARLGGDEFVIACTQNATPETIERLADRVITAVAEPITLEGRSCTVTASIGMARVDKTGDAAAALAAADAAMYRAKRLGRNHASL